MTRDEILLVALLGSIVLIAAAVLWVMAMLAVLDLRRTQRQLLKTVTDFLRERGPNQ